MGVIRGNNSIKNPEEIVFSMHDLNIQEDFRRESSNEFRLKAIFIGFFIFLMRFMILRDVPRPVDIVAALVLGFLCIEFAFRNVLILNGIIRNKGAIALVLFFIITLAVVIVGGNL